MNYVAAVFMILLMVPLHRGSAQEDFTVTQNTEGTITITGYRGSGKDVVIPETINGIPVTVIGPAAFRNLALSSVILPATVVSIETLAFAHNELTDIELPQGLSVIGVSAFEDNKLTRVAVPESVKHLRYRAFHSNPVTAVSLSVKAVVPRVFSKAALSRITIGSGTEVYLENFEPGFINYYSSLARRAGTYTKTDGVWKIE
ncbi:MAG: leucine-rich repeat domain-containing protein [Treponema sp.]|jgi:hypothetical protein|nr:leucine-rich repeat domain-containing protein [Treponema sp.]